MGRLKEFNDSIWHMLLKLLSNISDNVYIDILIVSIIVAVVITYIHLKAEEKRGTHLPVFGPFSMVLSLSVAYMVERLPMIHERIHRALGTTVGIIQSSEHYMQAFTEASGIVPKQSSDIASFLYFLSESNRKKWICNPEELYDSLFRTLAKTKELLFLPDVSYSCFAELSVFFIISVFVILMMGFVVTERKNGQYDKFRIFFYIIQSAFLIYTTSLCNGAVFCAVTLWITEELLYAAFKK